MASSSNSEPTEEVSFSTMDEKDPTLIGVHCQYEYCNQLDFLPFRCESCRGTFCLDHRTETGHQCSRPGEWAARRRLANQSKHSLGEGKMIAEVEKPCASPACARAGRFSEQQTNAKLALGKLKAWGAAQKAKVASTRVLPAPKPSSAAARLVAVNQLKKTAKGDVKLPPEKRVYINVDAEAATTTSKYPTGAFFYSKDWVMGRVLDAAAKALQVENVNNQGMDEKSKLRIFHVEAGRLLEFNEKVGDALVSGNRIVLLRGVGPSVPDLIEA
ncbi:hypothetical protein CJF30_00000985 [Rutstroemia sp. NJR-2017a BBW]|nr:hypothetical protein CJF30_00000985 [Rutstroemia sp. NJR-2017a BBW]